jgi:hypothetical protein
VGAADSVGAFDVVGGSMGALVGAVDAVGAALGDAVGADDGTPDGASLGTAKVGASVGSSPDPLPCAAARCALGRHRAAACMVGEGR